MKNFRALIAKIFPDPRVPVLLILTGYLVLGFTVLGFNRSPDQVLVTCLSAMALELLLMKLFRGKIEFPLSALITGMGLSILLNYSHTYAFLLIPVFFAIGSKYVFTFRSRHVYNPAMIGVVLSLLIMNELITSAPAYQWNGLASMAYFIAFPALMFFMPSINRTPLVVAFLVTFTCQVALRALIMRHHLPFQTLFLGTLSSPSFLLFTFFMITDPATSPKGRREQIYVGIALALIDLLFHIRKSYYTFFYAAFTLATLRLCWSHFQAAREQKSATFYIRKTFFDSGYYRKPLVLGTLTLIYIGVYQFLLFPAVALENVGWSFQKIPPEQSTITFKFGNVYERLDPRVQNIAKWLMSVGASVAAGDYDGDGKEDLFFTYPLGADGDRLVLFKNLGDFKFQRIEIPALNERQVNVEKYGLPTNAMWVDYDNDGDLDLFITYAFGSPVLLKNMLMETGKTEFVDVTKESGLEHYTNSITANWLDINRDGRLDLFIGNVLPTHLPDYKTPTLLNLFKLPEPEYEGDNRMFHFMHESWNNANNGGLNEIFLQDQNGHFQKQDSAAWGIPETRWTLAIGTGDLNHDGWTDIYVANDFGPDDLYYNENGQHFRNIKGKMFGSIGRDTYKGMNASVDDVDRNGWLDVYVSNVHHDMQAEGSLLWMFNESEIKDKATELGALNERRFGWGAALADFDNNGWIDIVQANGMVDDSIDKKFEKCPDYWYVNEKIARSPPWIHSYTNLWGDIRGMCIHGSELNRLYLNRGNGLKPQFVDVSQQVGLTEKGNSRGMAAVDLDNDGRLDLVTTHMFKSPDIYRNVWKNQALLQPKWVGFTLKADGKICNWQGIGSTVKISYKNLKGEDVFQIREAQVADGFTAQNGRRIHFGLGDAKGPVSVSVNWCQLQNQDYGIVPTNQYQVLEMRRP